MQITEFLAARYGEVEALARATTPVPIAGSWCASRDKHADGDAPLRLIQGRDPYEGQDWNDYGTGEYNGAPIIAFSAEWHDEAQANLRHIAYHDPARVLADLAAKRKRLEMYIEAKKLLEDVLKDTRPAALAEETPADFHTHVRERRRVQQASGRFIAYETAVRLDAYIYADHKDYDERWKLDA